MKQHSLQKAFNPQLRELEFRLNALLKSPSVCSPSKIRLHQESTQKLLDTISSQKEKEVGQENKSMQFSLRASNKSPQDKMLNYSTFNKPEQKQKNELLQQTFESQNTSRNLKSLVSPRNKEQESKYFSKELKQIQEIRASRNTNQTKTPKESTQIQIERIRSKLENQLTENKLIEANLILNSMKTQDLQNLPSIYTESLLKFAQAVLKKIP